MATPPFSYRKFWAECLGPAPELPMSRAEMDALGWDSCDIIVVTGDAYVDHPSFGMAVIGRLLEAQGFRVGIIAQPDWSNTRDFEALGKPNLFFGVAAGNMDSMINRYTADKKRRNDDAYTPGNTGDKRPARAVLDHRQRLSAAFRGVPLVIGSIEASLRRIAHYDYWSDKIRRSILLDSRADLLLYGNAERAIVDIAHRMAGGETIHQIRDLRGTAFVCKRVPEDWQIIDSTSIDVIGPVQAPLNPYADIPAEQCEQEKSPDVTAQPVTLLQHRDNATGLSVIRIPSFDQVREDPALYAHASRILHKETNPYNARPLVQAHGDREVWLNAPPIPLETRELDQVFELPYTRLPHTCYGDEKISAYEMIRHSVNIMRGCFGGCTFCSITEHEGRIIQNRSEDSILREIEQIRDTSPAFTGVISDLGGPTANMWRVACKSKEIEAQCRKLSCVFPAICKNLNTDQTPLVNLYRKAREVQGVKKVLIASGVRYDLAVETPEYVEELVTHHVGGYLKIAPEHTERGPLSLMMKPGIGTYERFRSLFEKYSKAAGKKQFLIPYFIAAHPGTSDLDMMHLALWLKKNKYRADQVQTYYPSPMATATAMYHSGLNPLQRVRRSSSSIASIKGLSQRKLHKAFLRYHDPDNWPVLRRALKKLGRADLIGNGQHQLIPTRQPAKRHQKVSDSSKTFTTQHLGLPRVPGQSGRSSPRSKRRG